MSGVRIQDRLVERLYAQYVFRGEQFLTVERGDLPRPGDEISSWFGEPGFRLTFDRPVHGPEDLPPGLLDRLTEAVDQFEHVREDGRVADPDDWEDDGMIVEWVHGPHFVGGNLVVALDTDGAGLEGRALDRVVMMLVAALEPFGSVEIGAASSSERRP